MIHSIFKMSPLETYKFVENKIDYKKENKIDYEKASHYNDHEYVTLESIYLSILDNGNMFKIDDNGLVYKNDVLITPVPKKRMPPQYYYFMDIFSKFKNILLNKDNIFIAEKINKLDILNNTLIYPNGIINAYLDSVTSDSGKVMSNVYNLFVNDIKYKKEINTIDRQKINKYDYNVIYPSDKTYDFIASHDGNNTYLSMLNKGGNYIINIEYDSSLVYFYSMHFKKTTIYESKLQIENNVYIICENYVGDIVEPITDHVKFETQVPNKFIELGEKIRKNKQNKIEEINNYAINDKRINEQIKIAINWCNKMNIPINEFYKEDKVIGKEKIIGMKLRIRKFVFPPKKGIDYDKLLVTDVGQYSVTSYQESDKISKIILSFFKNNNIIITDGTSGIGGNVLSFCKYFKHVNAVEYSPVHCKILSHNVKKIYGKKNVTIMCNDYTKIFLKLKQDVVFLDPPWGGSAYKKKPRTYLHLGNYNITQIINKLTNKTKIIVIKTPYNFDITHLINNVPYKKFKIVKFRKFLIIVLY